MNLVDLKSTNIGVKMKIKKKSKGNDVFFKAIKPTKDNKFHKSSAKANKYRSKWQKK
jgi:hypothetical protein